MIIFSKQIPIPIIQVLRALSKISCLQFFIYNRLLLIIYSPQLILINHFEKMQGDSLQKKQLYLRQKIIDAGHDAEKFVQFCSQKHNIDDLENWTFEQLVSIVQSYLNFVQPKPTTALHEHKDDYPSLSVQIDKPNNGHKSGEQQKTTTNIDNNKLGLVFTEDDWSILLSGPSLLGKSSAATKTEQPSSDSIPALDIDFGEFIKPISDQKRQTPSKQSPLSPPSSDFKPKVPVPSQNTNDPSGIIPISEIKIQKRGIVESTIPINLSNLILNTAKQRALMPLPQINQVSISKTQQVSRNFLQGDYTLYTITLLPCQISFQRKFADLLKLRAILQKLFPFIRLPYLEPEGWLSSSEGKDPQTLGKYRWMAEQFIRYILIKNEDLRNCEVVRFFCALTKKEFTKQQFRKKLQAYDSLHKPKFLGQVVLTANTITIPPTATSEKLKQSTVNVIGEIDVQYQRLRKQLDVLFSNYDLLLKSFQDIGNTFQTIQGLIYRHYQEIGQTSSFGAFEGLKQMTNRLSQKASRQCQTFRGRIRCLFRYQRQNMTTIKEVIDSSTRIHTQFVRQGSPSLPGTKVKGSGMQIESPVPLQQPIKNNKPILAAQQIFWSYQVRKQSQRYWQLLRKKINQHMTLIAYDELDSENENLNFWNTVIKRCVL